VFAGHTLAMASSRESENPNFTYLDWPDISRYWMPDFGWLPYEFQNLANACDLWIWVLDSTEHNPEFIVAKNNFGPIGAVIYE